MWNSPHYRHREHPRPRIDPVEPRGTNPTPKPKPTPALPDPSFPKSRPPPPNTPHTLA